MNRRVYLMAVTLVVALAGCGAHSRGSPAAARLEPLLLDLPPSYGLTLSDASGPLDRSLAAKATVVPPTRMGRFLDTRGYRAGYSRVWTDGDEQYLTALVLAFDSAAHAQQLVTTAIASVRSALGTYVTPLAGVPGGQEYGLSGRQRASGHYLFCAGAWFAVGRNAFTLTACSTARPVSPANVEPFAHLQYARLTGTQAPSSRPSSGNPPR